MSCGKFRLIGQSHSGTSLSQSQHMQLARKIILWIFPLFVLGFLLTMSEAYLKSVRIEEIPYRRTPQRMASLMGGKLKGKAGRSSGIHLISSMEHQRTFLHLFHVPCMLISSNVLLEFLFFLFQTSFASTLPRASGPMCRDL